MVKRIRTTGVRDTTANTRYSGSSNTLGPMVYDVLLQTTRYLGTAGYCWVLLGTSRSCTRFCSVLLHTEACTGGCNAVAVGSDLVLL